MPHKWRGTLEAICLLDNVKWAYREARRTNKDKNDKWLKYYASDQHLIELAERILNGTYVPKQAVMYKKRERNCNKIREIEAPSFETKIVEHMILGVFKWQIMHFLHPKTCASLPDRGIKYAQAIVRAWSKLPKKQKKYYVKGDIKKFFPSVSKEIALQEYRRHISDQRVINLIALLLPHDIGLPLGNVLVQYTANIVLTKFDYECAKWSNHFMRYMDDFVLLFSNKRQAQRFVEHIKKWTNENLNLKIKENESCGIQIWEWKKKRLDIAGYKTSFSGNRIMRFPTYLRVRRINNLNSFAVSQARSFLSLFGWVKMSSCHKIYDNMKKRKGLTRHIVSQWSKQHKNESSKDRQFANRNRVSRKQQLCS